MAAARHNHRIHVLYVHRRFDQCASLIEAALRESKGQCEYAIHVKALIARQAGQLQQSLQLFQQATALNPHNIANLKQVSHSLFLLGKHRAAVEVLDEALKLQQHDWELWFSKGMSAAQLQDHDSALQCFEAANSIQPQTRTFMQMGALHAQRGDLEAALSTYLSAVQHSPDDPELLTTLGLTFLRLGDNQRAFDHLATSLLHDPKNPRTLLAAGSIMQDAGDVDVALVKYRVAAAVTPRCPQLWNNIGMAFFAKQRYIAAIACLKRAQGYGPFEWVVAYNLGLLHLATQQPASAFNHLSAAVNLKPDFAHSYMYLALALAQLDDPDNAAAAFARAIAMEPAEPLLRLNHAVVLYNQGGDAAAREEVGKFRSLAAAAGAVLDPEALERAAQVEQLLGVAAQ